MHCPQCGQQQVSDNVRFCSRCGFPLDGVIQLLANSGMLPMYRDPGAPVPISPRKKGVRQGGILFLTGALLVPILGILLSYSGSNFLELLTAIAAILCFVGGPLRMLYAALFEEGGPNWARTQAAYIQPATPLQSGLPPRNALAPPPARQPTGWSGRPNTGQVVRPSVTEGTTRLLEKDERSNNH